MATDRTNYIVLHDDLNELWSKLEHLKERWGLNDTAANMFFAMQAIVTQYDNQCVIPECEKMMEE